MASSATIDHAAYADIQKGWVELTAREAAPPGRPCRGALGAAESPLPESAEWRGAIRVEIEPALPLGRRAVAELYRGILSRS
jgi:hypothetical protein